ncbi:bifunctional methylenetetrahydrofolate dehydrogenase/methenyltetrahydrofolate cyclohydrolase FolD [Sulfurospirillum sp. 1307]|jgi:methylenetetrahydrofolate dehydrogenase (NADP+)/methenyltetrahydrofolate cyclohydrolase
MTLLDGKTLSNKVKEEIKGEVEKLKTTGLVPGLAVILVGNDPASKTYVNSKEKACEYVGFHSLKIEMDENTSEEELLNKIDELNNDDKIHGILVQLPLPSCIDETKVLEKILPNKDVDGFHAYNVGKLVTNDASLIPCTPLGVMRILEEYNINPEGLDACVIGRSNIVGKPMMNLLINAGATVTVCHSRTKDLKHHTKNADLLVVGIGRANMIKADMVKDGAIVIDVGINRLENGKLTGDVDFEDVSSKCSYITPVPGGVGPMTIAMLLQNTLIAAKMSK